MTISERSLQKHREWAGKIRIESNVDLETRDDLSLAYTPGVAQACREIENDPDLSYALTRRHKHRCRHKPTARCSRPGRHPAPEASMPG